MKVKIFTLGALLILLGYLMLLVGCADKYKPSSNPFSASKESSCTHCHLNSSLLQEVATPQPPDTGHTGEG